MTDGDTSGNHRDITRLFLDAIHAGDDRGFGYLLGERAARQAVLERSFVALVRQCQYCGEYLPEDETVGSGICSSWFSAKVSRDD